MELVLHDWSSFYLLTSQSEFNEGFAKDNVSPALRIEPETPGASSSTLLLSRRCTVTHSIEWYPQYCEY